MTPNDMVGRNLKRAREIRGLTQEQAAEQLEPWLGARWSKANFSRAEARGRRFDADQIAAFAAAFELPLTFFWEPPESVDTIKVGERELSAADVRRALRAAAFADSMDVIDLRAQARFQRKRAKALRANELEGYDNPKEEALRAEAFAEVLEEEAGESKGGTT
jgi:transcriptional regulator with XRE-family HTH domain